jgi:triacylglycerol lipase
VNLPKLRSPIVLVHGLLGFDRLTVAGYTMANYFPGIVQKLAEAGNRVLVPALSPTGGVADRARQLKDFILANSKGEPVHILAHSMGGLDARYMISCLDMAPQVLTLTTLGTPHRGTPFADWGIQRLARLVQPVLNFLGLPSQGFYDVTTAKCRDFNDLVRDVPQVRYFSVAGRHNGSFLTPEWLLPYHIVRRVEGDNDGVVSIASAKWGEDQDVWEGDHLSLVNWLNPLARNRGFFRDPVPRFQRVLGKLADLGF